LTFETDNCVPGGHFAYSYVALRNTCAGLNISGPLVACVNSNPTYSVPALAGATYNWTVPSGWTITSGDNSNSVSVLVGPGNGPIIAEEHNSCADLKDTIQIATTPPTLAGSVAADAEVCAGNNGNTLSLSGSRGNILNWLSSTDNGLTWNTIADNTANYKYQNLNATTVYKVLVQNGPTCTIDSSFAATVKVDQKTLGGIINPANTNFCADQTVADVLTLQNFRGQIVNWQSSLDSLNWQNFAPVNTDSIDNVLNITSSTYYRSIVKNGVCPADTSTVASVKLFTTPFPQSTFAPADTTICYGTPAQLNAVVTVGTSYTWLATQPIQQTGNGTISSVPGSVEAQANPISSTDYVLSIINQGCPNPLLDTFHINVIPEIIVNAGNDTAVVVGQPLQFSAKSNDTTEDSFTWTPPTDLNNPNIAGPVGIYPSSVDSVTYTVRATDVFGCYGEGKISVKVFKTAPDIFVPNAFTPGKNYDNIFRPIPVGISALKYFRVYNRWGQLVYSTSQSGQGWDGNLGGRPQDDGTFVWMVQGTDYTGKTITRKGTMVLIR
jgi:gliding motility-associated-like protein